MLKRRAMVIDYPDLLGDLEKAEHKDFQLQRTTTDYSIRSRKLKLGSWQVQNTWLSDTARVEWRLILSLYRPFFAPSRRSFFTFYIVPIWVFSCFLSNRQPYSGHFAREKIFFIPRVF
jgi:hypothetical protein